MRPYFYAAFWNLLALPDNKFDNYPPLFMNNGGYNPS